jgi:ABC-type antimicrobial peptide transport system ATPase subunit
LPLQAADMLAWRMRKYAEDNFNPRSNINNMLPIKTKIRTSIWNKPRLERMVNIVQAMRMLTGDKFLYEMTRKERRKREKLSARRI